MRTKVPSELTAAQSLRQGKSNRLPRPAARSFLAQMSPRVSIQQIQIDPSLYDFVNREAMPDTGISAEPFWSGLASLIEQFSPRNAALMRHRDHLQAQIDTWHRQNPGPNFDRAAYKAFLQGIGYLVPEQEAFKV